MGQLSRQRGEFTSSPSLALLLRAQVRRVRRAARGWRAQTPADRFVPVRSRHGFELRLLEWKDGPSWTAAMRANEERMRPWWPQVEDWEKATDAYAFADHYLQWRVRRRAGTGLPLVIVGPAGVLGEINTWHLAPGAKTAETTVWAYPRLPRDDFMALWCGYFDAIFGAEGIEELSSPVAVANAGPVRIVMAVGAELRARVPRLREVAGQLADHDVYALRREVWQQRREALHARYPWTPVSDARPRWSRSGKRPASS